MTSSKSPPPFPYLAPAKDGESRESTMVASAVMGAMHCAYTKGVASDVLKDLWLNGLEAYRMACLLDATNGIAQRVRPGMDWKQAAQSFYGEVLIKTKSRTEKFLMICEAMLPEDKDAP
jgi:hypothetical protein